MSASWNLNCANIRLAPEVQIVDDAGHGHARSPTFDGVRREDFLQQRVVIRLGQVQIHYFDFGAGSVFLPGHQFTRQSVVRLGEDMQDAAHIQKRSKQARSAAKAANCSSEISWNASVAWPSWPRAAAPFCT